MSLEVETTSLFYGMSRTAFFDRGNGMIFCVKSHPVFLF